jgi:hypothetical protein
MHAHRELHRGARQHAERVAVQLVVALEQLVGGDQEPMITTFQTSGLSAGIVKWS